MNLTAIMPARNEGWVIGLSARAALKWCDALVVLDHASTDDTPELLESLAKEYPGRVYTISVDDPSWPEMAHRQQLLEFARAIGSTHIAPVDADEVLAGEMLPIVRGRIEQLGAGKYIGTPMESDNADYQKKNWSSVMLMNCAHYGWRSLTPDAVESLPGSYLHRFQFLDERYVGELPAEWNWLADEDGANRDAKLLHFTAGVPLMHCHSNVAHAADYHRQVVRMTHVTT
jgi:glycosyltransferase involved in cell wall biosynthesis